MMNPLVSISIPIFKCEEFIENALLSVKNQTYKNLEVILVNDKTQDNSVEICQRLISDYQLNNWKIIHLEKNSGLSVVRNEGISNAKGKYIFFLDSDDTLFPDAIESLVKKAEETEAEITMGEVEGMILPSGQSKDVFPINCKQDILEGNQTILKELVRGGFAVSSWNKLILLDFLKNNSLYFTPGLFAQDSLHTFEMALQLNKVAFLRKKTYRYYLHQNSVIHNREKKHFDNWITIAEKINFHLLSEKNSLRKNLILEFLIHFKADTLQMNWKAQKNEQLWKRSYKAYRQLGSLSFWDYFSRDYSGKLKKQDLFYRLPVALGYRFFLWRFNR